jgi:hypothetical protein
VQQTHAYQSGRIVGFALFTTNGNADQSWKSFETAQPELNDLADMIAVEWQPGEPEPPPEPPPPCRGLPREQYNRTVLVIPPTYSLAQAHSVLDAAWANKRTIGFSYDDAGIGDLDGRTARLYGIAEDKRQEFIDWYDTHYPGVVVEFADLPDEGLEINNIVEALPKHETLVYDTRDLTDITALTIHHTVSPSSRSIEAIALYHIAPDPSRNKSAWPGIGYHFVLKDDGRIYQTNYLTTKSYHAGSYAADGDENLWSVGIALQGDFTDEPPPQEQLDAARALVAYLKELLDIEDVLKHKEMPGASTQCPGNTSDDWIGYVRGE